MIVFLLVVIVILLLGGPLLAIIITGLIGWVGVEVYNMVLPYFIGGGLLIVLLILLKIINGIKIIIRDVALDEEELKYSISEHAKLKETFFKEEAILPELEKEIMKKALYRLSEKIESLKRIIQTKKESATQNKESKDKHDKQAKESKDSLRKACRDFKKELGSSVESCEAHTFKDFILGLSIISLFPMLIATIGWFNNINNSAPWW